MVWSKGQAKSRRLSTHDGSLELSVSLRTEIIELVMIPAT